MAKPLVTVAIPVKNGVNFLAEAIESVFAQTYDNIEIIIVDDGSDDNGATWNLIKSYGSRVSAVQQKNRGVAGALNTCIKNMHGHYFSWLSHDDLYAPIKIATQISFYEKNPAYHGILFSSFGVIDEQGALCGQPSFDKRYFSSIIYTILATYIHGCSLLIPKSAFDIAGLFSEKLKTVCDNDLWLRMALAGIPFHFQPYELVYSRNHASRATHSMHDIHKDETVFFFINAIKKLFPYLSKLDSSLLGEILVRRPEAGQALEILQFALQKK